MRAIVLAAAGSVLLAWAPAAWAQVDTSANAYRAMNSEPSQSYGAAGGSGTAAGGGRTTEPGLFERLFGNATFISPNDPTYSYSAPPHRGQPTEWELNGDDHGRGTSYPAILGHDSGN
jgi:hypothetical protein